MSNENVSHETTLEEWLANCDELASNFNNICELVVARQAAVADGVVLTADDNTLIDQACSAIWSIVQLNDGADPQVVFDKMNRADMVMELGTDETDPNLYGIRLAVPGDEDQTVVWFSTDQAAIQALEDEKAAL